MPLLKAFSQIRDALMEIMSNAHTILDPISSSSACDGCVGSVIQRNGIKFYEATSISNQEYSFDQREASVELLREAIGGLAYDNIRKLMFQKCWCFYASSASVHIKPGTSSTAGPVPPIKELIIMSRDPMRMKASMLSGKPTIPSELMYEFCQIAQKVDLDEAANSKAVPGRAASGDALCVDVVSPELNLTMNPCNLTWELRLLEPALAHCITSLYLTKNPVDISDVTKKRKTPAQLAAEVQAANAFKNPQQLAAEAEKAAAAAAAAAVSQRKNLNAHEYTFSTAQAWWEAYSQAPPFNRVDTTRRKIVSYFVAQGCETCGGCGNHLRVDSRSFPGFSSKTPLPASLARGEGFWARIAPVEGDWRLDAFEESTLTLPPSPSPPPPPPLSLTR